MKKVLCKTVSLILVMAMVMSMAICAGAAAPEDFDDFPSESYWATPALKAALANNILRGKGNGVIDSKANLTRAEMAAIITRAFGAVMQSDVSGFNDLDPAQWYYPEFAKAVRMGVFSGDENGKMNPNSPITREEAFSVFARAMVLSDSDVSVLSKFSDSADISGWAKEYLAPLIKKGYINGDEANNIAPKNYITRSEFAQFMHNMFKTYYSLQGAYKEAGTDSAMINAADVSLAGITVEDDLVIGDGADLGTINLTDVTINGRLLVRGAATVKLTNVTAAGGVVVNNVNATVHFDNYATESVFDGINMITPATFKENYIINVGGGSSGSSGTSTPVYSYYIRYYEQNLALNGYSLIKTETLSGKSGTTVTASVSDRRGFTYNAEKSVISGKISGSPYLVLEVYYDRNAYTVTFDADGGTPAPANQLIPYQGTITLPTVTKAGYTFDGWYDGDALVDSTTTVKSDMNLKARWTPVQGTFYTVTFKEGTSVLGEEQVLANSTLDSSKIPSTTIKYTGFTKDGSISPVYESSPKTYEAAYNWWYNPEAGEWQLFTDKTVVSGDITVYSTSQRVNLNLYVDKLGKSLTLGTYYAPDTRLADAINDIISQKTSLKAIKDTGYYEKTLGKLEEYNLIDGSGNIFMQEMMARFSMIIGESNLEEYIVDNAKEMFTTSDKLRNSIIEYIKTKAKSSNPDDVNGIKSLIEKIIAYSINTDSGMFDAEAMFRDMMESDDTFFKDVTGYDAALIDAVQKELIISQTVEEFETNTLVQAEAIKKVADYIVKPQHISRLDDYVEYALDFLASNTEIRDQVVDDIIETMYRDTLDKLLREVINEDKFEINKDNYFVAEGLKKKIEEFTFDEIKKQVPDKFFTVYPEEKLREIFEDASSRILAQVNSALADAESGITSYVDSGYTFIVNPVADIYAPLYERALELIKDKKFYYSENVYLQEVMKLFETSNLFNGDANSKPNELSGYSLKTLDEYYDIFVRSSILGDDMLVWYNENLNIDGLNSVIDNYEELVLKYVNLAADILDRYAKTGNIPDEYNNDIVSAFESAIRQKFPSLVNRLVDWYKTSPINKDYTSDDYAKVKKAVNFAFNNVNITVNEAFDDVLAKEFSKYLTAKDTYSKEYKGVKVTVYREIQR